MNSIWVKRLISPREMGVLGNKFPLNGTFNILSYITILSSYRTETLECSAPSPSALWSTTSTKSGNSSSSSSSGSSVSALASASRARVLRFRCDDGGSGREEEQVVDLGGGASARLEFFYELL